MANDWTRTENMNPPLTPPRRGTVAGCPPFCSPLGLGWGWVGPWQLIRRTTFPIASFIKFSSASIRVIKPAADRHDETMISWRRGAWAFFRLHWPPLLGSAPFWFY